MTYRGFVGYDPSSGRTMVGSTLRINNSAQIFRELFDPRKAKKFPKKEHTRYFVALFHPQQPRNGDFENTR